MAVETKEVREIVDFAADGFLVTSFYLNVDAEELPSLDQVLTSFDSTMHTAEGKRKALEDSLSHDAVESIRSDLEKIREFVCDLKDRTNTRSLAIFSCAADGFWEVFHMSNSTDNRVVYGPRPYVAPLAEFLSHTKPTAILLTDRRQARIFTMEHGEAHEWTDFQDFVPARSEAGGWSQMRYQRRSDHWAKHHVDHAAELTLALLKHHPFDWLIVGADVDAQSDLLNDLHPYLKDRVIGMIRVRIDAPQGEVLEKAHDLREAQEAKFIDELMSRVQEYAGAGGRGTTGLEKTLEALNEQKVHILVVQQGFRHPGSECESCGMLYAKELSTCPACNEPATTVDDIAGIAIQKAMELGSMVEVATEFDKLKPIGCIGAILYY